MGSLLHGDLQDFLQDGQEAGIQEPEEQREERADQKNDDGVLVQLFSGGPDDLLQFGLDALEIFAELTRFLCLCSCICHCSRFLSLLLRFSVQGFFSAELAVLHHLKTLGIVSLVLGGVVVSLFAFGAR